jgi:hypothetical protein
LLIFGDFISFQNFRIVIKVLKGSHLRLHLESVSDFTLLFF